MYTAWRAVVSRLGLILWPLVCASLRESHLSGLLRVWRETCKMAHTIGGLAATVAVMIFVWLQAAFRIRRRGTYCWFSNCIFSLNLVPFVSTVKTSIFVKPVCTAHCNLLPVQLRNADGCQRVGEYWLPSAGCSHLPGERVKLKHAETQKSPRIGCRWYFFRLCIYFILCSFAPSADLALSRFITVFFSARLKASCFWWVLTYSCVEKVSKNTHCKRLHCVLHDWPIVLALCPSVECRSRSGSCRNRQLLCMSNCLFGKKDQA